MSRVDRVARRVGMFLATLVTIGMIIALSDEGVRLYRGSKNSRGQAVPGYALYEKAYSSPLIDQELQKVLNLSPFKVSAEKEWQFVEFFQWEIFCRFQLRMKQRTWKEERKRLLKERGGFSMVLPKDALAEIWASTAPERSSDDPIRKVLYVANVKKRFGSLPDGPFLYSESDLPVERYRCVPTNMLYQPGQGWGFF